VEQRSAAAERLPAEGRNRLHRDSRGEGQAPRSVVRRGLRQQRRSGAV